MELKKVKYYDNLSEETPCFTAQLWVSGSHIANIKNDGKGGCNDFNAVNGFTYMDYTDYETMKHEVKIFKLVYEFHETTIKQTRGFYLKKGKEYYTQKFPMAVSKLIKHPDYRKWLGKKKTEFKAQGLTILNRNLMM